MRVRFLIVAAILLSWGSSNLMTTRAAEPEKTKPAKAAAKDKDAPADKGEMKKPAGKNAKKQADKKAADKKPAAAKAKPAKAPPPPWETPKLPGGKEVVTDKSPDFLKPPASLNPDVKIAKAVPTVDFAYFPGQTYRAEIWSVWGDSVCANGKYYASLGDHMYPGKSYPDSGDHHGAAFVYEFDPDAKTFKLLMDTSKVLKDVPAGEYIPGKIHSRLDVGSDGWIYCGTHRGSERATNAATNYQGDWILRTNPATGVSEVVVRGPAGKHCIPNSAVDPKRMIFYGGTAKGEVVKGQPAPDDIKFFAYDLKNKKMLYEGPDGPQRGMIVAPSTGKVYFTPKLLDVPLMCYDPSSGKPPYAIPGEIGIRTATRETPDGMVYSCSQGHKDRKTGEKTPSIMYSLNTKTEKIEVLGPVAIGPTVDYVAAMEADPTGRYVYYTVGAHGGSENDGSAIVQFDTKTKTKKVIAFLSPFIQQKYGVTPRGSFSISVSETGDKVFVTWNSKRDGCPISWDTVCLSAVHVAESERQP